MPNKGCGFIRKFRTCHLKKQKEHDRAWSELLAGSTNSRKKGNRKKNKTCHLFQLLPLFGSPKNFDEPNNFLLGLKKLNLKRRIFTMIVRELFSFSNNSSQIRLPKCSVPVFFYQKIHQRTRKQLQSDKREERPKKGPQLSLTCGPYTPPPAPMQ
jgi:hypothetical protein